MNFRYPVFLDVTGKRCLVTGEGPEIGSKVQMLVRLGADVVYVNPAAEKLIEEFAAASSIVWHRRSFTESDLDGCFLVITDSDSDTRIFELAEKRNILCNAVDNPKNCRFTFGSVVRRDDLTIAISTNGIAPALAVRLRQRLEQELGQEYSAFVKLLSEFRPRITQAISDFSVRKALWYEMIDSEALSLLRQGRVDQARKLLESMLQAKAGAGL